MHALKLNKNRAMIKIGSTFLGTKSIAADCLKEGKNNAKLVKKRKCVDGWRAIWECGCNE